MHSKEPLKEVAGLGRRRRHGASHRSAGSPSHLSLRICFGFDIRRRVGTCHLGSGALPVIGTFLILTSEISSGVVISH
jgi:hypothetical protein